eukprot:3191673-Pyramimonas_sp.AAC.2
MECRDNDRFVPLNSTLGLVDGPNEPSFPGAKRRFCTGHNKSGPIRMYPIGPQTGWDASRKCGCRSTCAGVSRGVS